VLLLLVLVALSLLLVVLLLVLALLVLWQGSPTLWQLFNCEADAAARVCITRSRCAAHR
jgi:hypothetical protein